MTISRDRIGIHLIEPFLAVTTSDKATHSKLKIFYQSLYDEMDKPINEDFFTFDNPWFQKVSKNMLNGIKKSYNEEVVDSVEEKAAEHMNECILLGNLIIPELRIVLGRQRRDYGLSEDFAEQYPVNEQAKNIDDTPVHN